MAFISIPNVAIRGISACVPSHVEENIDLPVFKEGEASRVIAQTGIERKHTVESGTTASDLCVKAANKLLEDLGWGKDTIDVIVFVSSSADYVVPPTACIIQEELAWLFGVGGRIELCCFPHNGRLFEKSSASLW